MMEPSKPKVYIANAHVRKMTERVFRAMGYEPPVICTLEELGAEQ